MALIEVALVEPEIPPNTGNIARTCAATGVPLHLVRPIAFDISAKAVRRAGLDYWSYLELAVHDDWATFRAAVHGATLIALTTRGRHRYDAIPLDDAQRTVLVFGSETRGLSDAILADLGEHLYRIPMMPERRSLNLGNSVALVLYDTLRRSGYPGLS